MNTRIELLMAVACLQQDIRTVIDRRATKDAQARLATQAGMLSPRNPRLVDGVPAPEAIAPRAGTSRSLIDLGGAGDHRCAGQRVQQ